MRICRRAEREGTLDKLLEVNPPLDPRRLGDETLLTAFQYWRKRDQKPQLRDLLTSRTRLAPEWESVWYALRQPDWWQGDSRYHSPAYHEPVSQMEARLQRDRFVISAEVAPPMEPSGQRIEQTVNCLRGYVDTANFTDNPLGVPRMSGLACALHSLQHNLEPVLQLQTRHRSRYQVASEAMGAAAAGVRNILCMIDDIGRLGPGPAPRPELNDLDAVQALWMLRRLRDEGIDIDGNPVEHRPHYFLGAMASPHAATPRYEAIVTEKKVNAGAQFLQTLPIFEMPRFLKWLEALDRRNVLGKVYLMPAVALLKSTRHTRFMANDVPGVYIPPHIMARMEEATDAREEGIQIALELISQIKGLNGVRGLHILAPHQEELVPRLVKESGLQSFTTRARTFRFSANGKDKAHTGGQLSQNSAHFTDSSSSGLGDYLGREYRQNLKI
jgi:methylenetetrahydrofolate reductase (NADPH)